MMNPMTMKSDPGGAVESGSDTVGPVGPVGSGCPGATAFASTRYGPEMATPLAPAALSVTSTLEMYQPLAPPVPPLLRMVTGGRWMPIAPLNRMDTECTLSEFPAWSIAWYSTTWVPLPATRK